MFPTKCIIIFFIKCGAEFKNSKNENKTLKIDIRYILKRMKNNSTWVNFSAFPYIKIPTSSRLYIIRLNYLRKCTQTWIICLNWSLIKKYIFQKSALRNLSSLNIKLDLCTWHERSQSDCIALESNPVCYLWKRN